MAPRALVGRQNEQLSGVMPHPYLSRRLPEYLDAALLHEAPLPLGALDLTQSNPHRCALDARVDFAALLSQVTPGYSPAALGPAGGRQSVARQMSLWGRPTEASAVMLTASTSEAFSYIFKMACDPGCIVASGRPGYPLVPHIAELEGLRTSTFDLVQDAKGLWHLDLDSVGRALTQGARVVVLVSPGNPVGAYLSPQAVAELALLCNRRGALVVFDEVFAPYHLQAPHARLVDVSAFDRAICVGGLSKAALVPEAKVGWLCVHGQPRFVSAALAGLEWIGDAYLSLGVTAQLVGPILGAAGAVQQALQKRVAKAYEHLRALCAASGYATIDPVTAGWYGVVRPLPSAPGLRTAAGAHLDLAAWLLAEAGVHLQPGYLYDLPAEHALVTSLIVPWPDHDAGWRRVLHALAGGAAGA